MGMGVAQYLAVLAMVIGFTILPIMLLTISPERNTPPRLRCNTTGCDGNSTLVEYQNITAVFNTTWCDPALFNTTLCYLDQGNLTDIPPPSGYTDQFIASVVLLAFILVLLAIVIGVGVYAIVFANALSRSSAFSA